MSDTKEILELARKFMAAWNAGDAHAAAVLYAPDGVRVGATGDISHGRTEIEAAYQKLLHGSMQGAKVEWEPSIRLLAPGVALAEGPLSIRRPEGGAPVLGYAVDIWTNTDGQWYIAEGHPKLFPLPAQSAR